jgi:hypothetical protein
LLGNDSVNTFTREPTRATIGRLLIGNGSINTPKTVRDYRRRCFPSGPPRGYIPGSYLLPEYERVQLMKGSFELVVVKNLVEFWRWQSKMIEKNWYERN